MQYQAPNFDFVALAAQQAGEGIKGYAKEKKKEADYNLNKTQAKQAYKAIYDQSVERYMQETGETDPYKAGKFVANYYMPPMSSESGKEMATRLLSVEPKFEAALKQRKVQIYQEKTAEPQQYQRPETIGKAEVSSQRTGLEAQRTPEQMGPPTPGQPTRPQYQSSARSLGQMQEATLNEPQAPGTMRGPSMTPDERYNLAKGMGVQGETDVSSDIALAGRRSIAGNVYGEGTTKDVVSKDVLNLPVVDKNVSDYPGDFPTRQQVVTNDRLVEQEKQRAKLRTLFNALQEKKLKLEAAKQTSTEDYKLLDAQIKLLDTQVKTSEALAKRAMGVKTGADPITGTYTFTTNKELDDLYKDNESTLISAKDLYERVNKKNEPIIPPMKPIKKFTIKSVIQK